jgi:hypothetical protein
MKVYGASCHPPESRAAIWAYSLALFEIEYRYHINVLSSVVQWHVVGILFKRPSWAKGKVESGMIDASNIYG